ncbi:siderophore-interacting protein [Corynebacterium sp. A21]|uniref:siderophore-interacting protein n=1 Tax=Corynebacterium sp. A21 TaxID=3457318 RepID=UPI003FD60161
MTFTAQGPVRAIVEEVHQLSPNFRRIAFGGPELAALGTDGPAYDQRIKLIFPGPAGTLPDLSRSADWYRDWLALPGEERGIMRTYSIRQLTQDDNRTRITVDFVLHLTEGTSGPAATWAAQATPGQEILIHGPRRGQSQLGVEFNPGQAQEVVLLGDETAAPAIARMLEDLQGTGLRGSAYIEVPGPEDALLIDAPSEFNVHWLAREGAPHGSRLAPALGLHLSEEPEADESPDLVWETPAFSGTGEELSPASTPATGTYYWIAGESGVVKQLRRNLVQGAGVERRQVAFMGYWKLGVSMRG